MAAKPLCVLLAMLVLAACAGQDSRATECDSLPAEEKEACMAELYETMEKYRQQQRKDQVQNPRY